MANFNIPTKIASVILHDSVVPTTVAETIKTTDVKLPAEAPAFMKTLKAEGKKWYLTVVHHEDTKQPFALFCHTNSKEKGATTSDAVTQLLSLATSKGILTTHVDSTIAKIAHETNVTKLTRVISLLLRHGVLIRNIVTALSTVDNVIVGSFLFQLKKFLSTYIKDGEESSDACSLCGGTMVFSEGCMMCRDCGNSKCG